jgi:hypothetical protein
MRALLDMRRVRAALAAAVASELYLAGAQEAGAAPSPELQAGVEATMPPPFASHVEGYASAIRSYASKGGVESEGEMSSADNPLEPPFAVYSSAPAVRPEPGNHLNPKVIAALLHTVSLRLSPLLVRLVLARVIWAMVTAVSSLFTTKC